jgi:internalin A
MREQYGIEKKPSYWRLKVAAIILCLVLLVILPFSLLLYDSKPDPASEAVIRQVAATKLNKDPNSLTDEDLAQITVFYLSNRELSDIRFLEKFTSLQELWLSQLRHPEIELPQWKAVLVKLHILNPPERELLDISPLRKLSKLQTLKLYNNQLKNIKPLSGLKNLTQLVIGYSQFAGRFRVPSLKPIKYLKNLQSLQLNEVKLSKHQSYKGLEKSERA